MTKSKLRKATGSVWYARFGPAAYGEAATDPHWPMEHVASWRLDRALLRVFQKIEVGLALVARAVLHTGEDTALFLVQARHPRPDSVVFLLPV
jgi:hypothetical protein